MMKKLMPKDENNAASFSGQRSRLFATSGPDLPIPGTLVFNLTLMLKLPGPDLGLGQAVKIVAVHHIAN